MKNILDSLINLNIWKHPMETVDYPSEAKINLLTGKITCEGKDSVTEFLEEKYEWFIDRIKDLNGDLNDFKKAEIKISGKKETVKLIYKEKEFGKTNIF